MDDKSEYKKIKMSNKTRNEGSRRNKIYKDITYNQANISDVDVLIEFDTQATRDTYSVVKLKTIVDAEEGNDREKLPYADWKGEIIIWLTSFQITDKGTKKFLDGVEYSVLFNKSDVTDAYGKPYPFVFYDGLKLSPINAVPGDPFVKIKLSKGDPSVGITKT